MRNANNALYAPRHAKLSKGAQRLKRTNKYIHKRKSVRLAFLQFMGAWNRAINKNENILILTVILVIFLAFGFCAILEPIRAEWLLCR